MSIDRKKPLKSIVIAPAGMRAWFFAGSALVSAPVSVLAPNPDRSWTPILHVCFAAGDVESIVAEDIVGFRGITNGGPLSALAVDEDEAEMPRIDLDALPVFSAGEPGEFAIDSEALNPSPAAAPQTRTQ